MKQWLFLAPPVVINSVNSYKTIDRKICLCLRNNGEASSLVIGDTAVGVGEVSEECASLFVYTLKYSGR